ncbi:MAG TPA: Gfo/Idh/MocA family oxidoreductase [Isosphaeraceae bacterium]|jgi:predicted dehydrogenase|nr:Gfo/Idh/MocA family oxidoreductase [Isosphaeraceae bacterium]
MKRRSTRRDFLRQSTAAGVGLWVVGSHSVVRGDSPNERVNVAIIGVAGRGDAHVQEIPKAGGTIVALCDVDDRSLDDVGKKHEKAYKYNDFRKMLDEKHKEIDAVAIATPDHTHAVAAMAAMKLGKHVYCEKPLTHSIHEARVLTETAAQQKVATQMGNQGHSGDNTRRIVEIVRSGAIGPVREVHAWTNRPIWPQGKDRPQGSDPVPDYLKWDLWLGPAPERPYVANKPLPPAPEGKAKGKRRREEEQIYHPFAWRGWWDFGTGALGDMACHILDASYWALDLRNPTTVVAEGDPRKPDNGPKWEIIRYEFPARGDMPPVKLTWYDGGKKPPEELIEGEEMKDGGALLIGDKGKIYVPHDYGGQHVLLPKKQFEGFQNPPESIPRSPGHHKDFIEACKDPSRPACSNFSYSGPLTETVLLGVVAFRVGHQIEWDGPGMKVTNSSEAEQYIRPEYRKGWSL